MKKTIILLLSLLYFACNDSSLYDPDISDSSLTVINITIDPEHYTELLENKLLDASVPAKMYYNNTYMKVHLSPQGAGSRYYPKLGLKVTCDDSNIKGIKEFNLSAQVSDQLMVRTTLSTYLYKQFGFLDFYSEVVFVKINNEDKGFFMLIEKVEEDYFQKRGYQVAELMKTVFDAKFTFADKNNPEATFEKKIPEDNNYSNLSEFIYTLDTVSTENISSALGKHLDIDKYIQFHVLTSAMNNTDGLSNNFYLYKEKGNSPYVVIPWDFDKSFNLKFSVGVCGDNHIIRKILKSQNYIDRYNKYRLLVGQNYFTESNLFPIIDSCYRKIKPFYHRDPYLYSETESLEERIAKFKEFITSQRKMILETELK